MTQLFQGCGEIVSVTQRSRARQRWAGGRNRKAVEEARVARLGWLPSVNKRERPGSSTNSARCMT